MDHLKKFKCHLNMEDIAEADYAHTKRVCKDFEIKNLGKYHGFYVQSDTLLLSDVFEFFKICALEHTNLILKNFFQLLDSHDKQPLKRPKLS